MTILGHEKAVVVVDELCYEDQKNWISSVQAWLDEWVGDRPWEEWSGIRNDT